MSIAHPVLKVRTPLFLALISFFYLFPFVAVHSGKEHIVFLTAVLFACASFGYRLVVTTANPAILTWFDTEVYVDGTPYYLQPGVYYMPTIPSLHLLTNGKTCPGLWANQHFTREDIEPIRIRHDSRRSNMDYRGVVHMTPWQAFMSRTFGALMDFFSLSKVQEEHPRIYFQKLSLRLVVLVWIVAFISPSRGDTWFWDKQHGQQHTETSEQQGDTVSVTIELDKQEAPAYPGRRLFIPQPGKVWLYEIIEGRKYFYYPRDGGKIPTMYVDDARCVAIPAGRKAIFHGSYAPTFALSMNKKITYTVTGESMPLHKKVGRLLLEGESFNSPFYIVERPWETAYSEWSSTVITSNGFLAEAQPLEKLSPRVYGGLVCF